MVEAQTTDTSTTPNMVFGGRDIVELHMLSDQLARNSRPKYPDGRTMLGLYKPMHFARRKYGKASIKMERSDCFDVVNMRYAHLLGVSPMRINFGRTIEFNTLHLKGAGMLTSDKPIEIYQQYLSFRHAKGDVLVGGLGLGMAAEMMLRLPAVNSVTVVERNKDIIKLIQPQIDKRIVVTQGDLYQYLRDVPEGQFDYAYHDIWYQCREETWMQTVVPLYRLSRKLGINDLGAWGEYEMHEQMRPSLYLRAMLPREHWWKPYAVFIAGCVKRLKREPPYTEADMPEVTKLVELFLTKVGTPRWENTFDWDGYKEVKRK